MFRVVFVLDIFNGKVVHAVKGEREKYRSIHEFSSVCSKSEPLYIINELTPREVYIADLNRLRGTGNNDEVIRKVGWKTKSMLDLGASNMDDIHLGQELVQSVVLGTETGTESLLNEACSFYPRSINMSIDIIGGKILTNEPKFQIPPIELVQMLNSYDIDDLIILELSKVGTSSGINPEFLKEVVDHSNHNIILGGGIRNLKDISLLKDIGLEGALVATSVHNGSIPVDMIQ